MLTRKLLFCRRHVHKKNLKKMQTPLLVEKSFGIHVVCENGGVDMNPIITAHQEIVIENSVRYTQPSATPVSVQ